MCLQRLLVFLTVLALSGISSAVYSSTVVLISPTDVDSPAITSIFRGISNKDKQSRLVVTENVNQTIEQHVSLGDSIIVLRQSLIAKIAPLESSSNIVGGAFYGTVYNPANIRTLSLEPSLDTVISEIQKIGLPLSKLRSVVSSSDTVFANKLYTSYADERGVALSPLVVTNERDAARSWFALLKEIDPSKEAILINDDKYLESSGAYRHIIETAWKRNILVVSTLPNYSRLGVSVGFIPDLAAYGQSLYDLLSDIKSDRGNQELWADTSMLRRVFNRRTLTHIGLRLPSDVDRLNKVDLIIE